MKNPPGYGSIVDLGKNRRRPIAVRVPNGTKFNRQGKEIISYKYIGYFERTSEGKKAAKVLLAQYNSGAPVEAVKKVNDCPTFKEMADEWLKKHLERTAIKNGKASAQLKHSYQAAILKCSPIHGKKIDRIKFQDVQDIADSISEMSDSTVRNVKIVLFDTFDYARKQKYITENFINDVEFMYKKKESKIHSSFERNEVELLWEHTDDANIQIILVMIYTGMRIEELLSMRTENVHIDEQYMVGGVKTSAGKNRIIPIADKILPFVKKLYSADSIYLLSRNRKRMSRVLFVNTVWDPVMEMLGMKHLPHDTRYTCASMMDRAGVNENCKKKILGHAGDGVTNKVYVEKDLKDLTEAINMI